MCVFICSINQPNCSISVVVCFVRAFSFHNHTKIAMMFQHAEKTSFSGFQEYFILLLLLLFIYLLHLHFFIFFLTSVLIFVFCTVV